MADKDFSKKFELKWKDKQGKEYGQTVTANSKMEIYKNLPRYIVSKNLENMAPGSLRVKMINNFSEIDLDEVIRSDKYFSVGWDFKKSNFTVISYKDKRRNLSKYMFIPETELYRLKDKPYITEFKVLANNLSYKKAHDYLKNLQETVVPTYAVVTTDGGIESLHYYSDWELWAIKEYDMHDDIKVIGGPYKGSDGYFKALDSLNFKPKSHKPNKNFSVKSKSFSRLTDSEVKVV